MYGTIYDTIMMGFTMIWDEYQPDGDVPQCSIVHVDDTTDLDTAYVDGVRT